ncbi:hypothetical protein ACF0H5_023849 [Mactra antiquata]
MPIPADFTESDLTEVHFTHGTIKDRTRRQTEQMFPQKLNVHFTVAMQQFDIDLSINLNFNPEKVPLYVDRNGVTTRVTVPYSEDYAIYQSTDHYGSFLITHDKNDNTHSLKKLFGTFRYNSSLYVIQPTNETSSRSSQYSVSKVPDQLLKFEYSQPEVARSYRTMRDNREEETSSTTYRETRRKRQSVEYEIEMFVVFDYKSYKFWYGLTEGNNRESDTFQLMMEYAAYLVNSIDNRYKSINNEEMVIDVLSAGVYVADNPSASDWSENNADGDQVPNSSTLNDFTGWIIGQTNLPQYDHAMALTGYDIVSETSTQSGSAGLAYKGGLCTPQSTSIVEETFNFMTMTTAAHELGHSLGSSHDGEDNNCNTEDNFIMATVNKVSNNIDNTKNIWIFSNCSVDDFRNFIGILDATGNNCMLSTSDNSLQVTTLQPMGEVYTADATCVNTYGEGSFVCRSLQNYTSICSEMFCAEPGTTQCYGLIPAEGLPCGQGKWCENGLCVASSRAPTDISDNCPIGNRPGLFDDTQLTCEEYINQEPGRCYGGYTRATCCNTCNEYYTADIYCEYGDVDRAFCDSMPNYGCYSNADYCCGKCKPLTDTSRPDCIYGDKLLGCNPAYCPFYSASQLETCCGTCASYFTPTTEMTTEQTPTTEKTTKETPTTEKTTKETPTTEKTTKVTPTTEKTTKETPTTEKTTKETERTTDVITVTIPITDKPTVSTGVETTVVTTPEEFDWIVVAIGGGSGLLAVIILVGVVCCVVRRKRAKMADEETSPTKDNAYDNIAFSNMDANKPSHPPPRRGSNVAHPFVDGVTAPLVAPVTNGNLGEQPDGYMKPVDLKADNGVHYAAPNKPKLPLVPPNKAANITSTDPNKRQSKPIHYKKPGNIKAAASGLVADSTMLKPSAEKGRRKSDAYDSIGEVQQKYQFRRPSLPLNHPSTLKAITKDTGNNVKAAEQKKISTSDQAKPTAEHEQKNTAKTKDVPKTDSRPIPSIVINSDSLNENKPHTKESTDPKTEHHKTKPDDGDKTKEHRNKSDGHKDNGHTKHHDSAHTKKPADDKTSNKPDKDDNGKPKEHRSKPDAAHGHKRDRSRDPSNKKEQLDPKSEHTRRKPEGSPERKRDRSRDPSNRKEHSDPKSETKAKRDDGSKPREHTRLKPEGSPERKRERSRDPKSRKEHIDPKSEKSEDASKAKEHTGHKREGSPDKRDKSRDPSNSRGRTNHNSDTKSKPADHSTPRDPTHKHEGSPERKHHRHNETPSSKGQADKKGENTDNDKTKVHQSRPHGGHDHKHEKAPDSNRSKGNTDPKSEHRSKHTSNDKSNDPTRNTGDHRDHRKERERDNKSREHSGKPSDSRYAKPHDAKTKESTPRVNNEKSRDAQRDRSGSPEKSPTKPPQKPVPRRQVTDSKAPATKHPEPTPRSQKPPSKPVPRRQTDASKEGQTNPAFKSDEQTTNV